MALVFYPQHHEYVSIDEAEIDWISVTTVTGKVKQPFADNQALKCSKNKKSKWYGLTEQEIKDQWAKESKRATDLGSWYHDQQEQLLCELTTLDREGIRLPICRPTFIDGVKHAPDQKLTDGIYPEHFVYLKSIGVCGQSDIVEVSNGIITVTDYKTNKELKTRGFVNWEKKVSMMQSPVSHLEDCHLTHYALQLSMYMFMILKHNPQLKPGNLIIHHIVFEEAGRDKYDNPITLRNEQGDPVVKEVIPHKLPYLKQEVINLLHQVRNNRESFKKK